MTYIINKVPLTNKIRSKIVKGFNKHSLAQIGEEGFGEMISFEIRNRNQFIGAIVVMPFFGALGVRLLFVEEKYRGLGIARQLMEHALLFAKEQGYRFATVETLSFQALEFYQKFGFELEFTRNGYLNDVSFHYLCKRL